MISKMKITDIQIVELKAELKETIYFGGQPPFNAKTDTIVKMFTDEGIVGLGSGGSRAVAEWVKPAIIGEDPLFIERTWHNLGQKIGRRQGIGWHGTRGLCAIDLAMWDIFGKACGKPVYQLLGGHKEKAMAYATMSSVPPEMAAEEALRYKEAGFLGCKLKLGVGENNDTWSVDMQRDIKTVQLTREAVGDDFLIMADANSAYDLRDAIKLIRALEEYDLTWFEEPMPTREIEDYRELVERTETPIAAGESEPLLCQHKDLLARGKIDILQPDVAANTCGLTEGKKIAGLAKAFGKACQPHTWGGCGINQAANLSLCCSIDNGDFCEYDVSENSLRQCLQDPVEPDKNGYVWISQSPGFGVDLDEEMIEKYRV